MCKVKFGIICTQKWSLHQVNLTNKLCWRYSVEYNQPIIIETERAQCEYGNLMIQAVERIERAGKMLIDKKRNSNIANKVKIFVEV